MHLVVKRVLGGVCAGMFASLSWAATFGTVVPIGGQASDIALDEGRGVLYIANYTANRIDVMSLSSNAIQRHLAVNPQPGALALSPDGQFLVILHYGPFSAPGTPANGLTILDLDGNQRQTFTLADPPLGVAFGLDDQALVVTANEFLLLDPRSGSTAVLDNVNSIATRSLPVSFVTFPPQIIRASVTATADGLHIYGVAGNESQVLIFSYNVATHELIPVRWTTTPSLGPRTLSVSDNGSYFLAGWALFGCDPRLSGDCDSTGPLVAQFPNAPGLLNVGSGAIDSISRTIYAQFTAGGATAGTAAAGPPTLLIADADNLTIRERIQLPENLAGRSVLNSAKNVLYSISDSGVMVLPVGRLSRSPRLVAQQEDLLFQGNFCEREVTPQQLTIQDAGGGHIPFVLSSSNKAVRFSSTTGTTPATVTVSIDPAFFQNLSGTATAGIDLQSAAAVNVPPSVRVLINSRQPDQRGSIVNVPGQLADLLADPIRDRFYILRQDRNQVLVFDGSTYQQIAVLRTSNTPTQMALTFDRKYLLVGHDNSQLAYVYDLDTLQPQTPIRFPSGHYPRSLAAAADTILAASRVAGPAHTIDRVDMSTLTAAALPTLGIYTNSINPNTVLDAAPDGSTILAAMADGNVLLYDAGAGTFTVSRKDVSALSGPVAASSLGVYVAGSQMLNQSLVPVLSFDSSAGFAFLGQGGFRATTTSPPAGLQRVSLPDGDGNPPTRVVETPAAPPPGFAFIRTVAPLSNGNGIILLTTSGFTILPWNYDAAGAVPELDRVVSTADGSSAVAPGSLVTIYGNQLSPVTMASTTLPVPTMLGESCLTLNGTPVPMFSVSAGQINAQLPYSASGSAKLVLQTPGGVSDPFPLLIQPAAPAVFQNGTAGPETGLPTVFRVANAQLVTNANPIHPDDQIVIYLAGMGQTTPAVEAGVAAPSDPLALVSLPPSVTLGGRALSVTYAGLVPGQVGIYQINATVPLHNVPLGFNLPLTVAQGGASATVPARVVE